uniref:UBC core domain-containing protein n=1 Tax=Hemiselmis tepida TaxID=464990 RepID=A0A7S0VD18_9CRYP|mmetsp:Transcript_16391/g.41520  ORF Transcript_16391/g.41520 Transcript_16391/m.41520 type:complete len:149 (+) Transcript_16391:122-568(+)|eukprot:CAMPEP_0174946504 /NCGR_PEP_ID=MMETSP1355-20121228/84284_1 /TAXON_ID=464990 /ORGANISM="Hemiselmis tepida, Strain CCMP443" /LENGTH=148 /DNA_ID=CAMNT_0016193935 /DNA_START=117 /DNA_END=563 /DNA_ORIENTATION=-
MATRSQKRLMREKADMDKAGMFGVEVSHSPAGVRWFVVVQGAEGTFYHGEAFRLQFTFSEDYPIEAPEVIFLQPAPVHPHIYSNGHICLSILYDGWSPALRVDSVCMSILSMLSSAEAKKPPDDNDSYVRNCSSNPKQTRWDFHDTKV